MIVVNIQMWGIFSIDIILPATLWSWLGSASIRNEYQEYSREVKCGWA
jgi:hypothetical protein